MVNRGYQSEMSAICNWRLLFRFFFYLDFASPVTSLWFVSCVFVFVCACIGACTFICVSNFFSIGLDNVLLHGWHDTQIYEVRAVFCARVCVLRERVCVCMLIVETPKPFYIYAYRYKHTCTPCTLIETSFDNERTSSMEGWIGTYACECMCANMRVCMWWILWFHFLLFYWNFVHNWWRTWR